MEINEFKKSSCRFKIAKILADISLLLTRDFQTYLGDLEFMEDKALSIAIRLNDILEIVGSEIQISSKRVKKEKDTKVGD